MSKERARRRAEREAATAVERASRERSRRRRARWTSLRNGLVTRRGAPRRKGRESALARHRARQNGILAAAVLAGHTVLWLVAASWWVRGSAALLTLVAWPLLLVVLFDRRPTA